MAKRGRKRGDYPAVPWQALAPMIEEANGQQEANAARFQTLLNSLAGTSGKTEEENKALVETIVSLSHQLGLQLTHDNHAISLRWHGAVFRHRSIIEGKREESPGATFPQLTVQPVPLSSVDITEWMKSASRDSYISVS